MQLRKMTLMLAVLGTMSMVLTGCPDGGRESLTCTENADCDTSEVCHPTAKVCVQTCTIGADCPESTRRCEAIGGGNTQLICKCDATSNCAADERVNAELVCNTTTGVNVCVIQCASDTDCATGQTCDVATGFCSAGSTPGQTCSGEGQSTCSYGSYCSSGTCAAAPVAPATCENFSSNRPQWSATTSNGPVIYSVEGMGYQVNSSFCQDSAPDAFLVRVRAYRPDTDWPSTRAGVSGFFYLTTGGDDFDVVNDGLLVPNTGYNRNTSNLKDAEFNIYLCRPTGSQTLQVGFYFTGGNPVCQQINR